MRRIRRRLNQRLTILAAIRFTQLRQRRLQRLTRPPHRSGLFRQHLALEVVIDILDP